jgi:hypothetical protein
MHRSTCRKKGRIPDMEQKYALWRGSEMLRARPHDDECRAVIEQLVSMVDAASRSVTEICTALAATSIDTPEKAKNSRNGFLGKPEQPQAYQMTTIPPRKLASSHSTTEISI